MFSQPCEGSVGVWQRGESAGEVLPGEAGREGRASRSGATRASGASQEFD